MQIKPAPSTNWPWYAQQHPNNTFFKKWPCHKLRITESTGWRKAVLLVFTSLSTGSTDEIVVAFVFPPAKRSDLVVAGPLWTPQLAASLAPHYDIRRVDINQFHPCPPFTVGYLELCIPVFVLQEK